MNLLPRLYRPPTRFTSLQNVDNIRPSDIKDPRKRLHSPPPPNSSSNVLSLRHKLSSPGELKLYWTNSSFVTFPVWNTCAPWSPRLDDHHPSRLLTLLPHQTLLVQVIFATQRPQIPGPLPSRVLSKRTETSFKGKVVFFLILAYLPHCQSPY